MGVRQVKFAQTLLRFMAHAHWAFPSLRLQRTMRRPAIRAPTIQKSEMNFDATGAMPSIKTIGAEPRELTDMRRLANRSGSRYG